MIKHKKDEVIALDEALNSVGGLVADVSNEIAQDSVCEQEIRRDLNDLVARVAELSNAHGLAHDLQPLGELELSALNQTLDELMEVRYRSEAELAKLSETDVVVASIAGIIAVVIDAVLVGITSLELTHKGGAYFDGSILTKALRDITDDKLSAFAKQLGEKAKVPYDLSQNDALTPNTHRLKSLAHDPFFGLFFAVFDIVFDSISYVDLNGNIVIEPRTVSNVLPQHKHLAVLYYVAHIVSDMFTSVGIPIPGFFLTQFFAAEGDKNSLAKIAERMYQDGYDVRHIPAMSTPVVAMDVILTAYKYLISDLEPEIVEPVAVIEQRAAHLEIKIARMQFIAKSIAISGNVMRFFLPPSNGNPCALNVAEWFAFLQSLILKVKVEMRDKSVEEVLGNREAIRKKWETLQEPEG